VGSIRAGLRNVSGRDLLVAIVSPYNASTQLRARVKALVSLRDQAIK
jgi:hypothetical protein